MIVSFDWTDASLHERTTLYAILHAGQRVSLPPPHTRRRVWKWGFPMMDGGQQTSLEPQAKTEADNCEAQPEQDDGGATPRARKLERARQHLQGMLRDEGGQDEGEQDDRGATPRAEKLERARQHLQGMLRDEGGGSAPARLDGFDRVAQVRGEVRAGAHRNRDAPGTPDAPHGVAPQDSLRASTRRSIPWTQAALAAAALLVFGTISGSAVTCVHLVSPPCRHARIARCTCCHPAVLRAVFSPH